MKVFTDYIPPPVGSNPIWWPVNAAQQAALASKAEFLLYGGASGGGKTDYLIADAMQEIENPNFRGLLLRISYGEMNQLMDRMEAIYRPLGARWKGDDHTWIFASGAKIRLGYMASDGDVKKYTGNPFSWLGVDESGFHPENRIRRIVPWLASTDPKLRVRARFATNPGNVGMAWHLKVFLRGRCPVHFPGTYEESNGTETSVYPGRVYSGSKWLSDDEGTKKTVCFIPALVTDNPLYGQEKLDSLGSQTAEIREQLLNGCWCQAEGMYFPFLRTNYMVPNAEIDVKWWWTHFISIDYGFGNSSAAATLYAVDESGRVYGLYAIVEKKMGSFDFAERVCKAWVEPLFEGNMRRIVCCYMDPANNQHHGTGQSNMEIMAEVFNKFHVPVVDAHKDSVDNAQQLYRMLSSKRYVICKDAKKVYDALSTRVHDDKVSGKIKKVHGEDLDDVTDSVLYGINTWLQSAVKPPRVAMEERIIKMREEGLDDHSIMIHGHRMEQAIKKEENTPLRLGRRVGSTRIIRR